MVEPRCQSWTCTTNGRLLGELTRSLGPHYVPGILVKAQPRRTQPRHNCDRKMHNSRHEGGCQHYVLLRPAGDQADLHPKAGLLVPYTPEWPAAV